MQPRGMMTEFVVVEMHGVRYLCRNSPGYVDRIRRLPKENYVSFTLPKPPKLVELKTRELTVGELQAALVQLIDLYNAQGKAMSAEILELKAYRESRRKVDRMNTPYDL